MPRGIPPLVLFVSVGLLLTILPAAAGWQPNGAPVCVHGFSQDLPSIASDGAGGAFILWRDARHFVEGEDRYIQRVTASGDLAPGWPAEGVPLCTAPDGQFFATGACLIADGQGGAIATWWDRRTGSEDDIYAMRMMADGTPAPGWPVDGVRLTAILGAERHATLASDGAGGAFIVWQDGRSGTTWDVYGMHVLADGTRAPGWPENGLPICTLAGHQLSPRVLPDGAGGAMVMWDGSEIRAVRLNAEGEPLPGWTENGNLVNGCPTTRWDWFRCPTGPAAC